MLAMSNMNGSDPFNSITVIWIIITTISIVLTIGAFVSIVHPGYSISNDELSNKSNTANST